MKHKNIRRSQRRIPRSARYAPKDGPVSWASSRSLPCRPLVARRRPVRQQRIIRRTTHQRLGSPRRMVSRPRTNQPGTPSPQRCSGDRSHVLFYDVKPGAVSGGTVTSVDLRDGKQTTLAIVDGSPTGRVPRWQGGPDRLHKGESGQHALIPVLGHAQFPHRGSVKDRPQRGRTSAEVIRPSWSGRARTHGQVFGMNSVDSPAKPALAR
jgi:hypothetical protein